MGQNCEHLLLLRTWSAWKSFYQLCLSWMLWKTTRESWMDCSGLPLNTQLSWVKMQSHHWVLLHCGDGMRPALCATWPSDKHMFMRSRKSAVSLHWLTSNCANALSPQPQLCRDVSTGTFVFSCKTTMYIFLVTWNISTMFGEDAFSLQFWLWLELWIIKLSFWKCYDHHAWSEYV